MVTLDDPCAVCPNALDLDGMACLCCPIRFYPDEDCREILSPEAELW